MSDVHRLRNTLAHVSPATEGARSRRFSSRHRVVGDQGECDIEIHDIASTGAGDGAGQSPAISLIGMNSSRGRGIATDGRWRPPAAAQRGRSWGSDWVSRPPARGEHRALPTPTDALVGRDDEVAALDRLLATPETPGCSRSPGHPASARRGWRSPWRGWRPRASRTVWRSWTSRTSGIHAWSLRRCWRRPASPTSARRKQPISSPGRWPTGPCSSSSTTSNTCSTPGRCWLGRSPDAPGLTTAA